MTSPLQTVRFHRSIAVRLAASAMLLVFAATVFLYVTIRHQMLRDGRAALESSVDVDLAGLADIHASGGQSELIQRLRDRLIFEGSDAGRLYLLIEMPDTVLAGNIKKWPPLDASRSQIGTFSLPSGQAVVARSTQLDRNLRLLVGRSTRSLDDALVVLRRTFVLWGGAAAVLALFIGLFGSRRWARRIERIDDLHRQAEDGEPLLEMPEGRWGSDELDVIATRTRRMLARQVELVRLYRESSEHAAHEIRTPLMHLDHRLHKLLDQSADPRVHDAVVRGREDVRGVVRLLEALLDISNARARMGDAGDFETIDLSWLVEEIVEMYAVSAEDAGFQLESSIALGITLSGNPMLLQRLLTNLLDNAFKFCPVGSTIRVELKAGPAIRVIDNGPGISAEDKLRIFKRFARSKNPSAPGHGLGLALASAIAERHGLVLSLEDRAKGACFLLAPDAQHSSAREALL